MLRLGIAGVDPLLRGSGNYSRTGNTPGVVKQWNEDWFNGSGRYRLHGTGCNHAAKIVDKAHAGDRTYALKGGWGDGPPGHRAPDYP